MTNIVKETSNYLRVETQYFASQKGFIFRGGEKKHREKLYHGNLRRRCKAIHDR